MYRVSEPDSKPFTFALKESCLPQMLLPRECIATIRTTIEDCHRQIPCCWKNIWSRFQCRIFFQWQICGPLISSPWLSCHVAPFRFSPLKFFKNPVCWHNFLRTDDISIWSTITAVFNMVIENFEFIICENKPVLFLFSSQCFCRIFTVCQSSESIYNNLSLCIFIRFYLNMWIIVFAYSDFPKISTNINNTDFFCFISQII